MHSTWRMLRDLAPRVSLFFALLPDLTHGWSRIWLDDVERRCALMHELVHIEHGHTSCQGPRVERKVRHETAKRLVPMDRLLEASRWSPEASEVAEELTVTADVLTDRIEVLTDRERRKLRAVRAHHP